MLFDEFLNKEIIVSQVKSGSKFNKRQQGTLIGLGLRGIGSSSNLKASDAVIGMIRKVGSVVKVSLA
jgi:ribosomal protein L30/L7E